MKAAKDTQDRQRHRHLDAEADKPGLDEIVGYARRTTPQAIINTPQA